MKRSGSSAREENYEHVLMCLICRSLFDDYDHQPKFLPCHHTFCKDCLREYIRQLGDEIECPSCRKVATIPAAGVAALQTNFYVKYIQALVSGPSGSLESMQCPIHQQQVLSVYCNNCQSAVCPTCLKEPDPAAECTHQMTKPLTTMTEESHQLLDSTFAKANATIDSKKVKLETLLKGLSDEKDDALKKIDSCFEHHVHTLNRRATLLKNKVIDIFSEGVEKIENDLMEISTALTCVVSLKDYHENKISHGVFKDFAKGIEEISEVNGNIEERIRPMELHINFEDAHGADKFRMGVKDLGRVRCVRSMAPRAEPDGNDGAATVPPAAKPARSASASSPDDKTNNTSLDSAVCASSSLAEYSPSHPDNTQTELNQTIPPEGADAQKAKGKSPSPGGAETPAPSGGKVGCPKTIGKSPQDGEITKESLCMTSTPKVAPNSPKSQKRELMANKNSTNQPDDSSETYKSDLIGGIDKNANAKPVSATLYKHNANMPEMVRRKVDKDYYHTVYTSYDEEELLKELKGVPRSEPLLEVDDDSDTLCEKQKVANMEDSDGWMTLSSGEDENGDAGDDAIPEDELTTL